MDSSTRQLMRRTLLAGAAGFAAAGRPARAQPSGQPIRVGVLTDLSSLYSDVSGKGSVIASQMAAEEFGRQLDIEVISADHQNKPDVAVSIARQWIDQRGVDVIGDVANSTVALAINTLARERNKVMLASGPSSSDLTGKSCSPNTVHWTYDTYALATGVGAAVAESGGKTWFDLVADYTFGHTMQGDIERVLGKHGGQVVGKVLTPINTSDFSSFLLQAQTSGAQVIGLVNAGGDTINSIKQAVEFGLTAGKQRLVATVLYVTDVHSLGLATAQGLQFTESFYWDLNESTRAWSKRFAARNGDGRPSALHAGAYASVLHYLKAVKALGSPVDGKAVVEQMKRMPTDDPLFGQGSIREDGRKLHPMYLFQVKTPDESKYPWDYYNLVQMIPAAEVWRPLAEGGCSFVKA